MVSFSEWIYNVFNWQLPTNKPLWTPEEGLQNIVHDDGKVDSLPNSPNALISITEQAKRERLFNQMVVRKNIVDSKGRIIVSNVPKRVEAKVDTMFANKRRYEDISHRFANPIRWYHIALIHEMECTQNFSRYLGNGQRLSQRTTIVPKGRGPFSSFEAGAVDAIKYDKLDKVQDWSIGNTLYILEGFNGYGYSLYRNINSPYLWSGSNNYTAGKYIADNVYSKTAVSSQIGIALLLQNVLERI